MKTCHICGLPLTHPEAPWSCPQQDAHYAALDAIRKKCPHNPQCRYDHPAINAAFCEFVSKCKEAKVSFVLALVRGPLGDMYVDGRFGVSDPVHHLLTDALDAGIRSAALYNIRESHG